MAFVGGVALLAVVASFLLTRWLRHHAVQLGLLDVPNARSSHTIPTPRGGGLAIAVVVLAGLPLLAWATSKIEWKSIPAYIVLGAAIAALGWMDDRRSLSARARLAAQMAVATLTITELGHFTETWFPFVGVLRFSWLGVPLTFLWIVGLTNAYNFMDGIDGLAAGQAVVAGVLWVIVGWDDALSLVSILGLMIAAAALGFLSQNWPPARIFMGDVASSFLGFTFAVLPLLAAQAGLENERYLIGGALFVTVFIFDSGLTFLRRLLRGENILQAHRSHLYQRLVKKGYSHRAVTMLYLVLAVFLGGCGLVYVRANGVVPAVALASASILMLALLVGVTLAERK